MVSEKVATIAGGENDTDKVEKNDLHDFIEALGSVETCGIFLTDLHKLRGTTKGAVVDIHGEPYDLGQEEGGCFENVAEHTATAMIITDILGQKLGLERDERANLNLAAWLHDSGKKTERMRQRAIESGEGDLILDENDNLGKPGQRKTQAIMEVAEMESWENLEAGIPNEVNRLMKANIPKSASGFVGNTAEMIMWFADACLSGAEIVPINERFDRLENDPENGPRNIEFSDSYKDRFDGLSLFQVARKLAKKYEPVIAQRIGVSADGLYVWLQREVDKRIATLEIPILPR